MSTFSTYTWREKDSMREFQPDKLIPKSRLHFAEFLNGVCPFAPSLFTSSLSFVGRYAMKTWELISNVFKPSIVALVYILESDYLLLLNFRGIYYYLKLLMSAFFLPICPDKFPFSLLSTYGIQCYLLL